MSSNTIDNRLKIISDLGNEVRKMRAHYDETLENDPLYQEVQEESKKFRDETKIKKEKVKSSSTLRAMEVQIKEFRDDIKDQRMMLAQELADYYRESGKLEITDSEGNTKKIVFSVKLVSA